MSALDGFRAAITAPDAPTSPEGIGALLATAVQAACAFRGLDTAHIQAWGPFVTMLLSDAVAWEAVIVGPDAYQFYPGFVREESITWANVWMTDNYSLEKFVRSVEAELTAAVRADA